MGYIYTVMWFMMALLLYSKFKNEGKIVYILSGYFLFAGVWWFANQLVTTDLMSGTYGLIFRGVSVLALIALIFSFFGKKKHSESENK